MAAQYDEWGNEIPDYAQQAQDQAAAQDRAAQAAQPAQAPAQAASVSQPDAASFIAELNARNNITQNAGAQYNTADDIAKLQGKKPEDVAKFEQDLTAQYALRSRPTVSNGGIGGSDDINGDGIPDPGTGTALARAGSTPGSKNGAVSSWNGSVGFNGSQQALYDQLSARASEGLNVDRNNPVIRQQSDAFRANQDRAARNYVGDVAEKAGPLANIRGEQRMAAEKVGQATSGFEAELMGREVEAKRTEIQNALTQMGSLLTEQQRVDLQRQLGLLNAQIAMTGQTNQNNQFFSNLSLEDKIQAALDDRARRGITG